MFLFALIQSATGGAGVPFEITLTIPAGRVASNLTNFPVLVDLSIMPDTFWENIKDDGGDIRVKTTGGTVIPHDNVWVDKDTRLGELYFLASAVNSGSDNSWLVTGGDDSLSKLPVTDGNGRNAVWANFERFYNFHETGDRTGSGVSASVTGEAESWVITQSRLYYNIHQGVAIDGDYLILIDTDFLLKITRDGKIVRQASGTLTSAGIAGGHIGDGCVIGNYLYVGGVNSASTATYIVRFNKDTLAYVDKFDISTESATSAASLAFNPADGRVYRLVSTVGTTVLHGYDPNDGSHDGDITLSVGTPFGSNGLTFHDGAIYIASDTGTYGIVSRYALNGTYDREIYRPAYSGVIEGLETDGDGILFNIYDPSGGDPGLFRLQKTADALPSALSFYGAGYADITVPKLTTWTMGLDFAVEHAADNQFFAHYGGGGDGEALAFDSTPLGVGLWNTTDGWAYVPNLYRFGRYMSYAGFHDGTTERESFMFGRPTTDAGVAAMPAGTGTSLRLGATLSSTEFAYGPINEFFLYDGALSDAWHAAWYNNRERPNWFFQILDDDASIVYPLQLALTNPGGEAGAMTGWSQINSSGLGSIGTTAGMIHTGSNAMIASATVATPWWGQTVAVPAGAQADVDAGLLDVEISLYMTTFTDADMGQIVVDCYDGSSNWLSGTQSPWYEPDQIERISVRTVVPPGTRNIRTSVRAFRVTGTENSVYVDDFEVALHRSEDRTEVGIVTSMELGDITGFTNTTGSVSATSSSVPWGETVINGGSNAATVSYKEYSLPAGLASEIAAGDVSLHFFGSIGNINGDDRINIQLQFVDGSNVLIGSAVKLSNDTNGINPAGRTTGDAGGRALFHPIYMRESVPTNAAEVRVTLSYTRVDGTVLDAGICRMAMLCTVDV